MPRYLSSLGATTTEVPELPMLVTSNSWLPFLVSACAKDLPSGEIAAQTDCPALVSGVILIVWKCRGDCCCGWLNRPMNPFVQRGTLMPINRKAATAATPEKTVALGWSLIPVKICSAVRDT